MLFCAVLDRAHRFHRPLVVHVDVGAHAGIGRGRLLVRVEAVIVRPVLARAIVRQLIQFETLVAKGTFLEHAIYNGHLYGTFRDRVEKARGAGRDVVLKIDVQGAEQVRRLIPDAVFIFVVAPSEQELEHRQEQRGSESPQDLAARREIAKLEMTYAEEYGHVVMNDDVERAVGEIRQIIEEARRRVT